MPALEYPRENQSRGRKAISKRSTNWHLSSPSGSLETFVKVPWERLDKALARPALQGRNMKLTFTSY